jgi:hypothetical protein
MRGLPRWTYELPIAYYACDIAAGDVTADATAANWTTYWVNDNLTWNEVRTTELGVMDPRARDRTLRGALNGPTGAYGPFPARLGPPTAGRAGHAGASAARGHDPRWPMVGVVAASSDSLRRAASGRHPSPCAGGPRPWAMLPRGRVPRRSAIRHRDAEPEVRRWSSTRRFGTLCMPGPGRPVGSRPRDSWCRAPRARRSGPRGREAIAGSAARVGAPATRGWDRPRTRRGARPDAKGEDDELGRATRSGRVRVADDRGRGPGRVRWGRPDPGPAETDGAAKVEPRTDDRRGRAHAGHRRAAERGRPDGRRAAGRQAADDGATPSAPGGQKSEPAIDVDRPAEREQ